MTSALGSIQISGLLGGTAGKIDTGALIDALMQAKSVTQNQLKSRLESQQNLNSNMQELNRRMQAVSAAAIALTDIRIDGVPTKATSSLASVAASSTGGAITGSSTFHVEEVAAAQVSTVRADGSGAFVADYTNGIDITVGKDADGNPVTHHIDLTSGSASAVASAINKANIGVRAAVVNTDDGQVLQFTAASSGLANTFTVNGLTEPVNTITTAQDAKVTVGSGIGAYSLSSSSNTFTDAMPGVTFTISAAAKGQDVTITVDDDVSALSGKIQALVDAVNSAKGGVKTLTSQGGLFQGDSTVTRLGFDMASVISSGTANGRSLTEFGIDMDKDGVVSFDATKFAAAYQSDASGTLDAVINSFSTPMRDVSEEASTPVVGNLSRAITADLAKVDDLNAQIAKWDERLSKEHDQLVVKFTAMQTALAKLQSQGDWLTNMFKSLDSKDD